MVGALPNHANIPQMIIQLSSLLNVAFSSNAHLSLHNNHSTKGASLRLQYIFVLLAIASDEAHAVNNFG